MGNGPKIKLCKFQAPCMGCDSRYAGCHSKCEKYIEYRETVDKFNAEKYERNEAAYKESRYIEQRNKRYGKRYGQR